ARGTDEFLNLHSAFLNHDAARSQQVRITLNKFRLSPGNDDLSGPGADVTNISLIDQLRWCSPAADQRCSHEGEEDKTRTKFFKSSFGCEKLLHRLYQLCAPP